jgi:hypothetical protein
MAKVAAYNTTNSPSSSSSTSKSIIGRPVESFSNIVGTDRTIKEACNIGGVIASSEPQVVGSNHPTLSNSYYRENGIITLTFLCLVIIIRQNLVLEVLSKI